MPIFGVRKRLNSLERRLIWGVFRHPDFAGNLWKVQNHLVFALIWLSTTPKLASEAVN